MKNQDTEDSVTLSADEALPSTGETEGPEVVKAVTDTSNLANTETPPADTPPQGDAVESEGNSSCTGYRGL